MVAAWYGRMPDGQSRLSNPDLSGGRQDASRQIHEEAVMVSDNIKIIYPRLAGLTDDQLYTLYQVAEDWIRNYYGRDLTGGLKCDHFSSMNDYVLFLKNPPVRELRRVRVNGYSWCPCDHKIRFSKDGKVYFYGQTFWNQLPGWSPGVNNIEIEYISEGQPQIRIDTMAGAVMSWFMESGQQNITAASERIGDYSYTSSSGSSSSTSSAAPPDHVQRIFAPFKRNLAC